MTDQEQLSPADDRKAGRARFAKNTAHQYLLQIAQYLFPFVTVPYLTRILGPDVYAIRAYVIAAMTMMQVLLSYGFETYGVRAIADDAHDPAKVNRTTSGITYLRLALCAAGAGLLALVAPAIPLLAQNPSYVAIAYVGACLTALLPDFVFQGQEDMKVITQRYVGSQAVAVACIFLFVHGPDQLLLVPAFEALATLIALVWSWANVVLARGVRFVGVPLSDLASMFRGSTVFFVSSASTTLFSSLTTLMIGIYVADEAQVSYWSLAIMAVSAIQALYAPIANSLYPHMVKRRDFALARRLLVAGSIAALAGSAAYAALSPVIMEIIGGEAYLPGSYVIACTAPILFFSYIAILLGNPVLAAVGKAKLLTASSVAAAAFHVVGLFALLALGLFQVVWVAVLRDLTEVVLATLRLAFARPYLRPQEGSPTNER